MRWLVLTPTFVAGLVVVVAAAMAAPTRSVHFLPQPFSGPCALQGCRSARGTGVLTRPKPKRLVNPVRVPASHAPAGGAGQDVLVQYRTVGQYHSGGFFGQIILASGNSQPLQNWVLRFSYPGQIKVWGGPPQAPGQHTVTITAGQFPSAGGWAGWSGGRVVQIVFSASGPPGPPASCTVNGKVCRYTPTLPSQDQGGGYGGGSGSYSG